MKVYISSTYKDLKLERTAVKRAIERLEFEPVCMEQYTASPQYPLDKCLRDVRECDAYIGILGWRYGYEPDPTDGRSITQLEYEAARDADRFVAFFLSPPATNWQRLQDQDLRKIQAFRDNVRERHMVADFATPAGLEAAVSPAISKFEREQRTSRGMPSSVTEIPPLLPFRCDREPQIIDVGRLVQSRNAEGKPLVVLLEGPEIERVDKLVECFRYRYLAKMLNCYPEDTRVDYKRVKWPREEKDEERFRCELLTTLGQELINDFTVSKLDDISNSVSSEDPMIILTTFPVSRCSADRLERIDTFVDFWLDPTWKLSPRPTIILLCFEYEHDHEEDAAAKSTSWWSAWWGQESQERAEKLIYDKIKELRSKYAKADLAVVTPRLAEVEKDCVDAWTEEDEVRDIVRRRDLKPAVREIFTSPGISMEPLSKELQTLLKEYSGLN